MQTRLIFNQTVGRSVPGGPFHIRPEPYVVEEDTMRNVLIKTLIAKGKVIVLAPDQGVPPKTAPAEVKIDKPEPAPEKPVEKPVEKPKAKPKVEPKVEEKKD